MHRTVPLPQDDARGAHRLGSKTTPGLVRIPHHHLVERHAHLVGRVAPQVLVGQKDDLLAALPGPRQRGGGVRRSADDAPVFTDERLDGRRGVDVRDWNNRGPAKAGHYAYLPLPRYLPVPAVPTSQHLPQFVPARLELLGFGHVGHRATGREVGQHHLLVRCAQHVGALGHEVHAAEHDELGVGMGRHPLRQLVRIADVVGEANDLVALIVMTEDHQPRSERGFGRGDAAIHLLVAKADVPLRQRLPLGQVALLVVGKKGDEGHVVSIADRKLQIAD